MKTIGIAGGSGFTGKHIAALLLEQGHSVIIFTRKARPAEGSLRYASWNPSEGTIDLTALSACDAMINLAGAGVADHRWTDSYKEEIISSRVAATRFLLTQLRQHAPACTTFVAAPATGYYGPDRPRSIPFTEESQAYADFLGDVCRMWEEASSEAAPAFRTVILRLGIILGRESGAYAKLSAPTRFGILPILGSGKQIVSWMHVKDLARLSAAAVLEDHWRGVYNAVSPHPVAHRQLMRTIAKVKGGIRIPAPVPPFVLNIMLGESSIEVLKSTTVSAARLQQAGFSWHYPDIESAVRELEQQQS